MNGISIGHWHSRPCSGEKTLRRCKNHGEADKVIVIDVDADSFDNVVIIDVPESLLHNNTRSGTHKKDKKWSGTNVICIDDDEINEVSHSYDAKGDGFSAGDSSNRESCHVNTKYAAINESECGQDLRPTVRLSNCKRTYSGKGSTGNCYGLDVDYESDSSDSDYPDCELVEDSSGEVQEQWEKASSRRKKNFQNGHPDIWDRDSSLRGVSGDHCHNFEMDDVVGQENETRFGSSAEKINNQMNDASGSGTVEGSKFCKSRAFDAGVECVPGENWESPFSYSFAFSEKLHKEFDQRKTSSEDVDTYEDGPHFKNSKSRAHEDRFCGKSNPAEDEATIYASKNSFDIEAKPSESFSGDNHKNFPDLAMDNGNDREMIESRQPHETGDSKKMENIIPKGCGSKRSTLSSKEMDHCSSILSSDLETVFDERDSQHTPDTSLFRNCNTKANGQEDNSASNIQLEKDGDGHLENPNGETLPSGDSCIISEREKLKETDEYKQAMEEEWASRQQALQIQAEEARHQRRLRKRRAAESMRLLDMERRQKQRVEEVRNIQRQDEENMNLKERIRAEVRMELKKLEVSCHDMASLLHSFGICVGGWPNPGPQEVQTAYKRALMAFHPDRASKSDIRHQVEAEEKFKLINRLKENFPLSL